MELLETENGVVNFDVWSHPLGKIGFLRDGWDERVEINGTGGRLELYSAQWDNPLNKASLLLHYDNASGNVTEYRYDAVSPFDAAVAYFCRNIEAGAQGTQPRTTGYDVDELIAHIQRSSGYGQALDIAWRL
jgi:hypothetical protein